MCGIAGAFRLTDEPIDGQVLQLLLIEIEARGLDSAGIALMQPDGTINTLKAKGPASALVVTDGFEKFMEANLREDTVGAILHARWATLGSPTENENNHPVGAEGGCVVVHNGHITNHSYLFGSLGLTRQAEVDTDIIRAIVDKHGLEKPVIRELDKMFGSCAAAIMHPRYPQRLLLLKSGSPLTLARTPGGCLLWASEKKHIHSAYRKVYKWKGLLWQPSRVDLSWGLMPDNSAYILDREVAAEQDTAILFRDGFRSCTYYSKPTYDGANDRYIQKTAEWEAEHAKRVAAAAEGDTQDITDAAAQALAEAAGNTKRPTVVKCSNEACGKWVDFSSKSLENVPLWRMCCRHCRTLLAEEPKGDQ